MAPRQLMTLWRPPGERGLVMKHRGVHASDNLRAEHQPQPGHTRMRGRAAIEDRTTFEAGGPEW